MTAVSDAAAAEVSLVLARVRLRLATERRAT